MNPTDTPSTDTRTDPAGTTIAGRYQIVRALGSGAFGHTFLARDVEGHRDVAVKLLDLRAATDWKARELFEREAAVLGSLRHHGVPEVYELVRDMWNGADAAFLVMEYVEGVSLAQMIDAQRPLDAARVMYLFLELIGILDYLHGRVPPILHRDIKPSNIIVRPDGTPALVDFGSVRRVFLATDEGGSTVVGTYGYMPYEQYMGQAAPASDLYALGATFLHLITGRPPRNFMAAEGRLEVPDALPGDARLRSVIARLLRPSPAERFASAHDVRQALLTTPGEGPVVRAATRSRVVAGMESLGPTPRAIEGPVKDLLDRVAPTMWELADPDSKPGDTAGFLELGAFVFLSMITAGALPLVFYNMARARRRRLERFFRNGLPAMAEILSSRIEKTVFESKIARVSYQFEADGALHRDADTALVFVADRWQPGDHVQILYLPEHDYDSVIISTS